MGLSLYLQAMEKEGLNPNMILHALLRTYRHVEQHGIPAGMFPGQAGSDTFDAMEKAAEASKVVEDEILRRFQTS